MLICSNVVISELFIRNSMVTIIYHKRIGKQAPSPRQEDILEIIPIPENNYSNLGYAVQHTKSRLNNLLRKIGTLQTSYEARWIF